MEGNAQVLDKELNLLLVGFFGMVFLMVLIVLYIGLIESLALNILIPFFLLTFVTH